ncbi:uncharacterized protein [Nicotiana tomentosiformis]|uniref:uncharacterized protein n=1 Tax=Nicotiana tomentosiformis TaxID=4098 RepID=UPI00388CE249
MADTSSAWQSQANVPQGDPNVIQLHRELHDHGQAIVELTTTMNQLAKAQLQQVQGPKQVNAMEGVNVMVNKRRQRGQQVQRNQEQFEQSGSGYNQDYFYDDQSKEVLYANNYQGQQSNAPNQQWRSQGNIKIMATKAKGIGIVATTTIRTIERITTKIGVINKAIGEETIIAIRVATIITIGEAMETKGVGSTVIKGTGPSKAPDVSTTQQPNNPPPYLSQGKSSSNNEMGRIENDEIQANDEKVNDEVRIDIDDNVEETQNDVNPYREHVIDILEMVVPKAKAPLPRPSPPYPQRLAKQNNENQFKKFIDMMKMSGIMHSMTPKLEVPDAFIIPCTIGSANFAKALCDLGESINLMPYSVFKTLGIGQPRSTSMRLQMVDRTMKRPLGIIDDVLVRVDKFILPANFVILDCEFDYEEPIILGRPLLAIGKALVDVEAGELTFRVGDEKVVFHMCKSMSQPNSNEVCSFVDLVAEVIVDDTSAMINVEDPLEVVLLNHEDDEKSCLIKCANALQGMGSYTYGPRKLSLDLENRKTPPTKPSIKEPPTLELKPLPSHLRYEFLGPCST